jgi:hypothetical protein
MIQLTVNCQKFHAKFTDLACLKQQAVREECRDCGRRDPRIKYVGLLNGFVQDQRSKGGKKAVISKNSRRSSTVEHSDDNRLAGGSNPSGGTRVKGGARRSLAEKTPIMAGDSTLEVVASVTRKAPPPNKKMMRVRQQGGKGLISLTNAGSNPAPASKRAPHASGLGVGRAEDPSTGCKRRQNPRAPRGAPINRPAQMAHSRDFRWPGYLRPMRRVG